MTADMLNTLARCKALALAAMIEAGGRPCWVASAAPPAAAPPDRERALLESCFSAAETTKIQRILDRLPPSESITLAAGADCGASRPGSLSAGLQAGRPPAPGRRPRAAQARPSPRSAPSAAGR